MRRSDIEWIARIILTSGIGTKEQRFAIVQRIWDKFDEMRGSTNG